MRFAPALAAALLLAACSSPNTIEGNALLRTRGGDVRTCAGYQVALVPATTATERVIREAFGEGDSAFKSARGLADADPLPPSLAEDPRIQSGVCDAQGDFAFDDLKNGEYFVVTQVLWDVPGAYGASNTQGGTLMQKVAVQGGETRKIVLTQ